jgi:hypothetical protein
MTAVDEMSQRDHQTVHTTALAGNRPIMASNGAEDDNDVDTRIFPGEYNCDKRRRSKGWFMMLVTALRKSGPCIHVINSAGGSYTPGDDRSI